MAETAVTAAIVHADADHAMVGTLADALEQRGIAVADDEMQADVVIVLWSTTAVRDASVLASAATAAGRGRLVQVLAPGLPFGQVPPRFRDAPNADFARLDEILVLVNAAADRARQIPPWMPRASATHAPAPTAAAHHVPLPPVAVRPFPAPSRGDAAKAAAPASPAPPRKSASPAAPAAEPAEDATRIYVPPGSLGAGPDAPITQATGGAARSEPPPSSAPGVLSDNPVRYSWIGPERRHGGGQPTIRGSAEPVAEPPPLNRPISVQQLAGLREAAADAEGAVQHRSRDQRAAAPTEFSDNEPSRGALRDMPRPAPLSGGPRLPAPNDGPRPPPLGSAPQARMRSAPAPERYASRVGSPLLPILVTTAIVGGLAWYFSDKLAGIAAALIAMIKGTMPPAPGVPRTAPVPPTDIVDCSVFAPPAAAPGARIRIQVFLHLDEQLAKVAELARRRDARAVDLGTQTLKCPVPRGSEVDIELQGDGLEAETTAVSIGWHGKPDSREFVVRLPKDADGQEFLPKIILYLDGEPVGSLVFSIVCQRQAPEVASQLTGRAARRFRKAFFSYSSKDRDKVNVVARSYSLIDQDFFQDILDLDAGQRWEQELYRKIDECDLFVLFWSESARQSEWVRREVEYALRRERETGAPQFMPFPLGDPPPPTPWDSLKDRHLGDPLYFKLAEKRRKKRFWEKAW